MEKEKYLNKLQYAIEVLDKIHRGYDYITHDGKVHSFTDAEKEEFVNKATKALNEVAFYINGGQIMSKTPDEFLAQINQAFIKVFGKDLAKEVWFNGRRAEGCSLIIVDSVWSYQMDALMKALNEVPGLFELPFGEWRVRKARLNYIVNQNVPRDVRDNCYEVRLIFKDFLS